MDRGELPLANSIINEAVDGSMATREEAESVLVFFEHVLYSVSNVVFSLSLSLSHTTGGHT